MNMAASAGPAKALNTTENFSCSSTARPDATSATEKATLYQLTIYSPTAPAPLWRRSLNAYEGSTSPLRPGRPSTRRVAQGQRREDSDRVPRVRQSVVSDRKSVV